MLFLKFLYKFYYKVFLNGLLRLIKYTELLME